MLGRIANISLLTLLSISSSTALASPNQRAELAAPQAQDAKSEMAEMPYRWPVPVRRRDAKFDGDHVKFQACVVYAAAHEATSRNSKLIKCIEAFTENDPCLQDGLESEHCSQREFGPGARSLSRSKKDGLSDQKRILVVDEFMPSPSLTRYRGQIEGFYSIQVQVSDEIVVGDEHGRGNRVRGAEREKLAMMIPKRLGAVLEALSDLKSEASSSELQELLPPLIDAYGHVLPKMTGHGNTVTNILLDLVPERQVVLLDLYSLDLVSNFPRVFCHVNNRDLPDELLEAINRLAESLSLQTSAAISDLILRKRVRYINASFGITSKTIAASYNRYCGRPITEGETEKMFGFYEPVMKALFAADGTLALQAANETPPLRASDARFDSREGAFANRIRVGNLLNVPDGAMDGAQEEKPSFSRQSPYSWQWADIYVNSGCDWTGCREAEPLSITQSFGLGRIPFPAPATSFVTPLALAEVVRDDQKNLKNIIPPETSFRSIQMDFALNPYRDPLMEFKEATEHTYDHNGY